MLLLLMIKFLGMNASVQIGNDLQCFNVVLFNPINFISFWNIRITRELIILNQTYTIWAQIQFSLKMIYIFYGNIVLQARKVFYLTSIYFQIRKINSIPHISFKQKSTHSQYLISIYPKMKDERLFCLSCRYYSKKIVREIYGWASLCNFVSYLSTSARFCSALLMVKSCYFSFLKWQGRRHNLDLN